MESQLAKYIEAHLPAANVRVTNLSRIPGGASRETWMFDAAWSGANGEESQAFVVRKDPPASLLDTDRETEYAFYSTFWGTEVPVPRMRWLERDASILGGPFFIMDRILDCEVNTRLPQMPPYLALQPVMAQNLYGILGAIATHDWAAGPVAKVMDAPTPETSWQRELRHWEDIIDAEEISPQPIVRAAIRWLRANPPPPAQRISVVHGDFRVGNFLYKPDASIHGVLDWEMAHLGDPIEDLAYSFNESWRWARDGRPGGIVDRETAITLWEEASGLRVDPAALHWWELFNDVKLQGIWLKSARVFQEAKSSELIHLLCAYSLINSQDQAILHTMGEGDMKPDLSRALQGVGITLISKIIPEMQTAFGQQEVGLAAQLVFWAAEEAERGADSLVNETRATRALLQEGLQLAGAAREAVQTALATPAAANLRLSTLEAENDGVRRGLVALHAALEANPAPEAAALSERIWAELVESTKRRQFQARLG